MTENTARSRHSGSIGQGFLWALLPAFLLILTDSDITYGQVATNITPTSIAPLDLGTNVDTVGSATQITGGTRPGSGTNLFHSFDAFSLGTGDTAHFLNDMQLPTTNIVGRVIGGEVSTIDGTLRTNNPLDVADPMNFGSANLWLVNPSGLFLGANARIEVGGSVSLSTANYLRFEGTSTLFDMLSSPASLGPLSVAPVAAFGFLGPDLPAPITVRGSMLQVPEGQALSLVGGDITIQAETFEDGTIQAANLRAPGGQLNLVSVASPGEVLVPSFQTGPNINGASFSTRGTVTLKDSATLDVSNQLDVDGNPIGNGNNGTVFVRGGQLVMDGSAILATTVGAVDGARTGVDIQVSQDVALTNASAIATITFGPGRPGDVQITAGNLTMETGAVILTATIDGDGVGGDVVLNVETVLMGDSSIQSVSQSSTAGLGQGGNVTIQGLQGTGSAAESVALSGVSTLLSQTVGSGEGGRVAITTKSLMMEGIATVSTTAVDVGRGGDIVLSVQQASLSDWATIRTETASVDSNAGMGGTVTLQGLQGAGSMADSVALSGFGSGIISETLGALSSGDVAVHAKTVSLTDGARIQTGTPSNTGAGGNVTIDADSVDLSGGSHITSQSAAADAGHVTLTANALTLDNGSIETNTSSGGRGGDVTLDVGSVNLVNGATINSSTSEAGRAGDVTMTVGSLTLANHSEITSSSSGSVADAGDAGTINIESGSTVVLHNSVISAEASQASGGDIMITAPEMVRLTNSRISTSVSGGRGSGGNITIDPQFVILQNSLILASAVAGIGGNITIDFGVFLVDPNSVVEASGALSLTGTIQTVGGQLTPLPQQFTSSAALLFTQRCAADATGQFSSFVQTGRDGVPQVPGALSPSPLSFLETLTSSSLGSPSPNWASARLGLDSVHVDNSIRFYSACRS